MKKPHQNTWAFILKLLLNRFICNHEADFERFYKLSMALKIFWFYSFSIHLSIPLNILKLHFKAEECRQNIVSVGVWKERRYGWRQTKPNVELDQCEANIPTRLLHSANAVGLLLKGEKYHRVGDVIWYESDYIRGHGQQCEYYPGLHLPRRNKCGATAPFVKRTHCLTWFRINTWCLSHVCHHVWHVIENPGRFQKCWKSFAQIHKKGMKERNEFQQGLFLMADLGF